jgi:hypothetical protein
MELHSDAGCGGFGSGVGESDRGVIYGRDLEAVPGQTHRVSPHPAAHIQHVVPLSHAQKRQEVRHPPSLWVQLFALGRISSEVSVPDQG